MDWKLVWLLNHGYQLASQWTYRIYIKVPTRYFIDTAGNIYMA